MDKLRSFLGIRPEPPRNDFRNPIWGDDDDDGDELYDRHASIEIHTDPDLHEITKHMQSMFRTFSNLIIGDNINTFFHEPTELPEMDEDLPDENYASNSIRDFYLKPGYQIDKPADVDLDGKISSSEMSGLLKKKGDAETMTPFDGNMIPGRSFCKTIITTSVTKPDGTIETRRIVKHGNGVTEDITTSSAPGMDHKGSIMDPITPHNMDPFFKDFIRDFTSQWRHFN